MITPPPPWTLPTDASIHGCTYEIATDYRDILEIIAILNDPDKTDLEKRYISLGLFYDDLKNIPPEDMQEAVEWMFAFIGGFDTYGQTCQNPSLISWEQDRPLILTAMNKEAGHDIRGDAYMHWLTFLSLFASIGESEIATVVGIRDKQKRGKKLDESEKLYYKRNRGKVDIKVKPTEKEQATFDKWTGIGRG